MVIDRVEDGRWKPFRVSRRGPLISHLLFADDLLLFGEASTDQARCFKECLNSFCQASGQKVNESKSVVFFSKNVHADKRKAIQEELGFRCTSDLGNYLGVPLRGGKNRCKNFDYIINKVRSKLAGWKAKSLSRAGRITLAKSVISAMPIYTMQAMKIPVTSNRSIEQLQNQFVWGSESNMRKTHLVSWDRMCKPKEMGGLGFRKLEDLNSACGAKLYWKLMDGSKALWKEVLQSKYGDREDGDGNWRIKQGDSSLAKFIYNHKNIVDKGTKWVVRDGKSISFLKDQWLEPGLRICDLFIPDCEALRNESKVSDWVDIYGLWDFNKMEDLLPKEIVDKIKPVVPPNPLLGKDVRVWGYSNNGEFSIKSAYNLIAEDEMLIGNSRTWRKIWKWKGLERVKVFMWLAYQDRLLTNARRSKWTGSDPVCKLCGKENEDIMHALRDCQVVKDLWEELIYPKWRTTFFSKPLLEWFDFNLNQNSSKVADISWDVLWAYGIWLLWNWRNKNVFDNEFVRHQKPAEYLIAMCHKLIDANQTKRTIINLDKNNRIEAWEKPKNGWIKLNVDGAVNAKSGTAGCGGVARDEEARWRGGFFKFLGTCSVYEAEAWGIKEGLNLVWKLGYKRVVIESDSQNLINDILSNKGEKSSLSSTVIVIREMFQKDWIIQLKHIRREANMVADVLAKHAVTIKQSCDLLLEAPEFTGVHVLKDRLGIYSPTLM